MSVKLLIASKLVEADQSFSLWCVKRAESDEREEGEIKWRAQDASRHNERMREQSPFCPALLCFAFEMFSTFSLMHGRFDILK